MVRHVSIPMYVQPGANASLGVATYPLPNAIQLDSIVMTWPANTSLNLLYRFFFVATVPTDLTTSPGGGEITTPFIPTGKFAGESISIEYPFQRPIDPTRSILIFFATNNTSAALSAEAVAIVSVPD